MNAQFSKRQLPAGNPLANALVVIVGALAIAASFVLGVAALIVLGSIVLVFAALVGIRVWWFNRHLSRQVRSGQQKNSGGQTEIIEGEYHFISTVRREDPRPRQ